MPRQKGPRERMNILISDETKERLLRLAARYGNMSNAIEEAVVQLERREFPDETPGVIGYEPFIAAVAMKDADGVDIPAGTTAYRERLSGGGHGDVVSREALIADGVLNE